MNTFQKTTSQPRHWLPALLLCIALMQSAPSFAQATGPGYALRFNGSSNLVQITGLGNSVPTSEITIEFWLRVSTNARQFTINLSPQTIKNNVLSIEAPSLDGRVYWYFGNINSGQLAYTPPVPLTNAWQHFAFVASQSGNSMAVYRNGVLESQKSGMTPFIQNSSDLVIGARMQNLTPVAILMRCAFGMLPGTQARFKPT